jgi:triphosphoribosyl-dephospho-CoA synthetase
MNNNISDIIIVALSLEVALWPKPGLVTALDGGCHNDMNILSFFKSSVTLRRFFEKSYDLGVATPCRNDVVKNISLLRIIGIEAEFAMNKITNNVNTHKGAIFIFVILAYAVGFIEKDIEYELEDLFEIMAIIGQYILREDFLIDDDLTHRHNTTGSLAFKDHQILGIRGVAADGFKEVLNIGIPIFKDAILRTHNLRLATLGLLIKYMSILDDTTIMNRKFSIKRLHFVKKISAKCLQHGGGETILGRFIIGIMGCIFRQFNISPGGSADMVALTLTVYFWYFGYPEDCLKW